MVLSVSELKSRLRELEGERALAEKEFSSRLVVLARARARIIGELSDANWIALSQKEKLDLNGEAVK